MQKKAGMAATKHRDRHRRCSVGIHTVQGMHSCTASLSFKNILGKCGLTMVCQYVILTLRTLVLKYKYTRHAAIQ